MKEIFTEEEYQEAVKKYNECIRTEFYNNIDLYSNYEGYEDLRNFELSKDDFKFLWRLQDLLYSYEQSNCSSVLSTFYNEMKTIYLNRFKMV